MPRATTPPMGWNSWDSYGTTVTEDEVLANARHLADHLLASGWDTVVVDIAWFDPTARSHGYNADAPLVLDAHGRLQPDPVRFPSAVDGTGFTALAAAVHDMGLKFGIHLMRGIPRRAVALDLPIEGTEWTARDIALTEDVCLWNPDNYGLDFSHPGAQAFMDGQIAQIAAWGVDFLKVDDMLSPYHDDAIEALHLAIERAGADITVSLSPGTELSTEHAEHLRENAQMWRISDDLWDRWIDVHAQFARLARWAPFQQEGGWADADMLPLGRIGIRAERGEPRDCRLTLDEQRTMMALWSMARSPLMVGGDLPSSTPETTELLATPAITEVLQGSVGGREILREPLEGDDPGEHIVWTARSATTDRTYVAVFWTGDQERAGRVPLTSILGRSHAPQATTDLFSTSAPSAVADGHLTVTVPSHGVAWVALDPVPAA
ncbi:alpha-galactosidase [Demequina sp. NBRC 110054]|uniref:alpha-galactosidase n=1 Tax=Demequina sp. NBRC 110054 TaxID=1570343 RepID=UPI0011778F01|nr:alpha-galactosidase [Demequina sp. NBRC 110054]